jgi:hypothetical protein
LAEEVVRGQGLVFILVRRRSTFGPASAPAPAHPRAHPPAEQTKDDVGFDTKPKGCLPLGGAAVSLLKDKVTFELAHPIFASGELLMVRAGDTFDANEWITQIKAAMTATWENAILGFGLIEKMKSKGTALEDEKEAVLQEAKANAERLQREKEESERLAALKFQTVNELEAEKLKMETEVEDLKKKSAGLEGAQAMERAAYEEEKKRRQAIESALQAASKALSDLEQAFTVREKDAHGTVFKDNAQVKSNVANLKVFFEAHAAQHEKRRAFFKRG